MSEAAAQLSKGTTIGRYVVLGLLGRGGMGEVYAAFDPELDRKIAIKLLKAAGADADAVARGRQRLQREAQAIARVSSPNVVAVHDVGTFGESVFIAMEFVEGHTLHYWLQAATRSWREVLAVFIAAGRGLAGAHAAGLIHRDFKPENVMVAKSGEVRVMDFGLAREQREELAAQARQSVAVAQKAASIAHTLDAAGDPDATMKLATAPGEGASETPPGGYLGMKLTETGAMMGTPAYMAPEQFVGEGSDARTDQFSFAVALWEALYGRRPFGGDNPIQLMVNVVSGVIREPPPDTRVPAWIRPVLLRGMQVDRARRYPTMAELLAALGRDPTVRRRRWIAAAAGLAVLAATGAGARRLGADRHALCAGGAGRAAAAWGPEGRAAAERAFTASGNSNAAQAFATAAALLDDYVGQWTHLYTETCEATHVRGDQSADVLDLRMDCLGERLASVRALAEVLASADVQVVDNAVAAASGLPGLARCSDVAMLRAVVKPPDDPATRARVAALRDEVAKVTALGSSGQCARAAAAGEKLITVVQALGYQPLTAEALLAVGRLGETCTDPSRAVAQLEEASYAAEMSRHDQVVIEASAFVGGFYADPLRDLPNARRWIRHGEVVLARFPGHPILEAWLAISRSMFLAASGETAAGIDEMRRALALIEKERGPAHLDVAVCLQNIGSQLFEDGQYAAAEAPTVRSFEMMKRLFGNDGTRTAALSVNLGEILTGLRRFDEARPFIEHALSIWRKQQASAFFIGYTLHDRARLELERGDDEAARATLVEARQALGNTNPQLSAEVDFAFARVSWAVPAQRRMAVRLARQARQGIREPGRRRKIAEIDAWLASHDGLPVGRIR